VLVDGADLAVDQRGALGDAGEARDQEAELLDPVVAVARENADLVTDDGSLGAVAVVLHLKDPAVARGNLALKRRQLRRPKGWKD
jgi:hypothetical protein